MFINFLKTFEKKPSAAIFISGKGTNAVKLLDHLKNQNNPAWIPKVIVTDRPARCKARDIAKQYSLPIVEHDIFDFYQKHGLSKISIATEEGTRIRELWTQGLREKLLPFAPDFGILAGFIPMTNLTNDLPCLNVHPGDLTIEKDGRRILAGLNVLPLENAILLGHSTMRSSVIVPQPFTAGGREVDCGPILGISAPVKIDLCGFSVQELQHARDARKERPRKEWSSDPLAVAADINLEKLKVYGDWILFHQVTDDFASGKFTFEGERIAYCGNPVKTVEYSDTAAPRPIPEIS